MKVQRVYVDTSGIGGCFDEEFALWSKGLMEDFRQGTFKPVLSEIVAAEIAPAPEQLRAQYAELLTLDPQFAAFKSIEIYSPREVTTTREGDEDESSEDDPTHS